MATKIKLVIVGIGGVGGYFGGLLSKKYSGSTDVEIIFVARGAHLKHIKENGLKVITGKHEFITRPDLATANFNEIGIADYIIICTKSYDLAETIQQLKPCVDKNTILLPLLNGVDATDRIKEILPEATVLKGCAFIVSRLKAAGVIENSGSIQKLSFGLDTPLTEKIILLEHLCLNAGIAANCTDKIAKAIWEKFIFISATATATSYFNSPIGKVLEENNETIIKLIDEVKNLALAKEISISSDISEKTLHTMKSMKYEVTSSMHSDYLNRKPETEVESLTGYVVHEGIKMGIEIPTFALLYKGLIKA
ncbi:2-dehydropantoate 2-reductase [Pedobacter chinensis]|uniref:2-dehydropantoate 2-reductase n=1 Tax=Pedobacter chinensis TaxID=2282421 RepID=A0A369PX64_9SPHI|nr:2-dehydropantoate 2-reductase [Pedobacter chinensis]RDC56862.1 2-dehydropantoate 2-reductase [Pedobacter chinensis]